MNNFELFAQTYKACLTQAVHDYPLDYPWYPNTSVDVVYGRMVEALKRNSYNKDGHAFKNTCKRLGIKYTYKAIEEYIGLRPKV